MNVLMVTGLVLSWFICESHCVGRQHKDYKPGYLSKHYGNLANIPPPQETAAKFAKYFLGRDINVNKRKRRPRNTDFVARKQKDTVFIIDSSESVKRGNFKIGLKALERVIKKDKNDTHFAAITFSNHAKLEFTFVDKETARGKMKKIQYRPGKTNTQEALKMALNQLIKSKTSNIRLRSKRRILLVTDGLSNVKNHLTLMRGAQLKAAGVEIFVIAVGKYDQGLEEIAGLASSTYAHLYRVRNMKGLSKVVKWIPSLKRKQKTWLSGMNIGGS